MRVKTGYKKTISKSEIDTITKNVSGIKARTILRIMQYTGMRIGDACSLERNSIKDDFGYFRIVEQKTGKVAIKPIPVKLKKILKVYLREVRLDKNNKYLFQPRIRKDRRTHIQSDHIRWSIYKAARKTGLEDCYYVRSNGKKLHRISPHTWRHYFATQVYEKSGYDARAAKDMLNHVDIKTTFRHYIDDLSVKQRVALANLVD